MPLLNYTTTVTVRRSLEAMQAMLVEGGAQSITVSYADQRPVGLVFEVVTPMGLRSIRLPARAERVLAVLEAQRLQPRYRTAEHADRVAWRILKDWLEAQLAVIAVGMASLDEVMLPYMVGVGGRSVYEVYVDQQMALPEGRQ